MANYRRNRINDAVAQELNLALREVRDPRVTGALVSVTRAEVAPDLRNATVYFSCMGDAKEVRKALIRCAGLLRHHLATTVNLRITPELAFVHDDSISHGARIAELLSEIEKTSPAHEEGTTEEPK
mgnify:FL=1